MAQAEIPGTERKKNKRIEGLMEELKDAKRKLTSARNKHKDAEATTIAAMKDEGMPEYTSVDLGMTLRVEDQTHAKLSPYKPPEEKKKKTEAEA